MAKTILGTCCVLLILAAIPVLLILHHHSLLVQDKDIPPQILLFKDYQGNYDLIG